MATPQSWYCATAWNRGVWPPRARSIHYCRRIDDRSALQQQFRRRQGGEFGRDMQQGASLGGERSGASDAIGQSLPVTMHEPRVGVEAPTQVVQPSTMDVHDRGVLRLGARRDEPLQAGGDPGMIARIGAEDHLERRVAAATGGARAIGIRSTIQQQPEDGGGEGLTGRQQERTPVIDFDVGIDAVVEEHRQHRQLMIMQRGTGEGQVAIGRGIRPPREQEAHHRQLGRATGVHQRPLVAVRAFVACHMLIDELGMHIEQLGDRREVLLVDGLAQALCQREDLPCIRGLDEALEPGPRAERVAPGDDLQRIRRSQHAGVGTEDVGDLVMGSDIAAPVGHAQVVGLLLQLPEMGMGRQELGRHGDPFRSPEVRRCGAEREVAIGTRGSARNTGRWTRSSPRTGCALPRTGVRFDGGPQCQVVQGDVTASRPRWLDRSCALSDQPLLHTAQMDLADLMPAFVRAVTAIEEDAPYASAYARRNAGTLARVDSQRAAIEPVPPQAGFTLTAWTGERFLELSCDDITPAAIERSTQRLRQRLAGIPRPTQMLPLEPGEPQTGHYAHQMGVDARQVPQAEKLALARELRERLATGEPRLLEAFTIVGDIHAEIVFVNRSRQLAQQLHRVQQIAVGVYGDGSHQAQLHGGFERIGGWEHQTTQQAYLEELRRDGPRLLGAPRLPDPGEHDCVFSGEFAGLFAHEAFGHGTEQDMFLKDRAKGAEYLGRSVASPLVQMYDDPANGWGASYFFDDEGVLASPTEIIRDGVLVRGINDRYSAAALRAKGLPVPKTANGRREAYDHKPYTRMTNTFFGPGSSTVEEMIASVRHGYYITHSSNGMEDPKGWGIQLEGSMAEEIRDGRLSGRVFAPVVVTGSVPTLLASVSMVGRTLVESSLGMCGKGYKEWVKVTAGGPALRLRAVLA